MEETNVLAENPTPYDIWARRCCERHSGEVRTLTLALRYSHQAVRARSNTVGVPHHISNFDSLPVAEVAHAAVDGNRAPRRVAEFCVLTVLLTPARSRLSYAYTKSVVSDTSQVFVDSRDLKC